MNCRQCRARLGDLLDGSLSASEREKVAAHLAGCAACAHVHQNLESELHLTRAALRELSPRPAPLDLRLKVRAALQDAGASERARPARTFNLLPKNWVWTGTLTFAAFALLLLAKPFPPLAPAPSVEAPSQLPSDSSAAPAPSEAKSPSLSPSSQRAPSATRWAKRPNAMAKLPRPAASSPFSVSGREKPVERAKTEMSASVEQRGPTLPTKNRSDAAPLTTRNSISSATGERPVAQQPERSAAQKSAASPTQPRNKASSNFPGTASPLPLPRIAKSQSDLPSTTLPAPPSAPSEPATATRLRALENRSTGVASGPGSAVFVMEIAPPSPALPASPSAIASNAGAAKGNAKEAANAGARGQSDQNFAAQAPKPEGVVATPNAAPQSDSGFGGGSGGFGGGSAGGRGGFGGGGGGLGGGGGGVAAPRPDAGDLALGMEKLASSAGRQMEALAKPWKLKISTPRELTGVQIRVVLPPALHFEASDMATSRVVWRGDWAPAKPLAIEIPLLGVRGGEKISVVVEQNGAGGESKVLETQILTLPAPGG